MDKKENALDVMLGNPPVHEITGLDGKKYQFTGLSLFEIREIMNEYGDIFSILWSEKSEKEEKLSLIQDIDFHILIAWLGSRAVGLNDEQLEKGEWKITKRKLIKILPPNIPFLMGLTTKIFEMTKWGIPQNVNDNLNHLGEEEKNSSPGGKQPPVMNSK